MVLKYCPRCAARTSHAESFEGHVCRLCGYVVTSTDFEPGVHLAVDEPGWGAYHR